MTLFSLLFEPSRQIRYNEYGAGRLLAIIMRSKVWNPKPKFKQATNTLYDCADYFFAVFLHRVCGFCDDAVWEGAISSTPPTNVTGKSWNYRKLILLTYTYMVGSDMGPANQIICCAIIIVCPYGRCGVNHRVFEQYGRMLNNFWIKRVHLLQELWQGTVNEKQDRGSLCFLIVP
jgi:hypothetical protein